MAENGWVAFVVAPVVIDVMVVAAAASELAINELVAVVEE